MIGGEASAGDTGGRVAWDTWVLRETEDEDDRGMKVSWTGKRNLLVRVGLCLGLGLGLESELGSMVGLVLVRMGLGLSVSLIEEIESGLCRVLGLVVG